MPGKVVEFLTSQEVGYTQTFDSTKQKAADKSKKQSNAGYLSASPKDKEGRKTCVPSDYRYFQNMMEDDAFCSAVEPLFDRYIEEFSEYREDRNPLTLVHVKKQFLVLMYEHWKKEKTNLKEKTPEQQKQYLARVLWETKHNVSFQYHLGLNERIKNFVLQQYEFEKSFQGNQSKFFSRFVRMNTAGQPEVDVAAYVISLQQRRLAKAVGTDEKERKNRPEFTPRLSAAEKELASQIEVSVDAVELNGLEYNDSSATVDPTTLYMQRSMNMTGPRLEVSAQETPLYKLLVVTPNITDEVAATLPAINEQLYQFTSPQYQTYKAVKDLDQQARDRDYMTVNLGTAEQPRYIYIHRARYQEFLTRCFQTQLQEQLTQSKPDEPILINDMGLGQGTWLPTNDTTKDKSYAIPVYIAAWQDALREFAKKNPGRRVIVNLNDRGYDVSTNKVTVSSDARRGLQPAAVPAEVSEKGKEVSPAAGQPLVLERGRFSRFSVDQPQTCFIQFSNAGYADFPGLTEDEKKCQRNLGMVGDAKAGFGNGAGPLSVDGAGGDSSMENSYASSSTAPLVLNHNVFEKNHRLTLEYNVNKSDPTWRGWIDAKKAELKKALQDKGIDVSKIDSVAFDVLAFNLCRLEGKGIPALAAVQAELGLLAGQEAREALAWVVGDCAEASRNTVTEVLQGVLVKASAALDAAKTAFDQRQPAPVAQAAVAATGKYSGIDHLAVQGLKQTLKTTIALSDEFLFDLALLLGRTTPNLTDAFYAPKRQEVLKNFKQLLTFLMAQTDLQVEAKVVLLKQLLELAEGSQELINVIQDSLTPLEAQVEAQKIGTDWVVIRTLDLEKFRKELTDRKELTEQEVAALSPETLKLLNTVLSPVTLSLLKTVNAWKTFTFYLYQVKQTQTALIPARRGVIVGLAKGELSKIYSQLSPSQKREVSKMVALSGLFKPSEIAEDMVPLWVSPDRRVSLEESQGMSGTLSSLRKLQQRLIGQEKPVDAQIPGNSIGGFSKFVDRLCFLQETWLPGNLQDTMIEQAKSALKYALENLHDVLGTGVDLPIPRFLIEGLNIDQVSEKVVTEFSKDLEIERERTFFKNLHQLKLIPQYSKWLKSSKHREQMKTWLIDQGLLKQDPLDGDISRAERKYGLFIFLLKSIDPAINQSTFGLPNLQGNQMAREAYEFELDRVTKLAKRDEARTLSLSSYESLQRSAVAVAEAVPVVRPVAVVTPAVIPLVATAKPVPQPAPVPVPVPVTTAKPVPQPAAPVVKTAADCKADLIKALEDSSSGLPQDKIQEVTGGVIGDRFFASLPALSSAGLQARDRVELESKTALEMMVSRLMLVVKTEAQINFIEETIVEWCKHYGFTNLSKAISRSTIFNEGRERVYQTELIAKFPTQKVKTVSANPNWKACLKDLAKLGGVLTLAQEETAVAKAQQHLGALLQDLVQSNDLTREEAKQILQQISTWCSNKRPFKTLKTSLDQLPMAAPVAETKAVVKTTETPQPAPVSVTEPVKKTRPKSQQMQKENQKLIAALPNLSLLTQLQILKNVIRGKSKNDPLIQAIKGDTALAEIFECASVLVENLQLPKEGEKQSVRLASLKKQAAYLQTQMPDVQSQIRMVCALDESPDRGLLRALLINDYDAWKKSLEHQRQLQYWLIEANLLGQHSSVEQVAEAVRLFGFLMFLRQSSDMKTHQQTFGLPDLKGGDPAIQTVYQLELNLMQPYLQGKGVQFPSYRALQSAAILREEQPPEVVTAPKEQKKGKKARTGILTRMANAWRAVWAKKPAILSDTKMQQRLSSKGGMELQQVVSPTQYPSIDWIPPGDWPQVVVPDSQSQVIEMKKFDQPPRPPSIDLTNQGGDLGVEQVLELPIEVETQPAVELRHETEISEVSASSPNPAVAPVPVPVVGKASVQEVCQYLDYLVSQIKRLPPDSEEKKQTLAHQCQEIVRSHFGSMKPAQFLAELSKNEIPADHIVGRLWMQERYEEWARLPAHKDDMAAWIDYKTKQARAEEKKKDLESGKMGSYEWAPGGPFMQFLSILTDPAAQDWAKRQGLTNLYNHPVVAEWCIVELARNIAAQRRETKSQWTQTQLALHFTGLVMRILDNNPSLQAAALKCKNERSLDILEAAGVQPTDRESAYQRWQAALGTTSYPEGRV